MIKAVVFDFGNVICRFDNRIILRRIAEHTGKTVEEVDRLVYRSSDVVHEYETGLISSAEFFNYLSSLCELRMSMEKFAGLYTGKFTPIEGTFALIRRLEGKYKLGLLSNTSEMDFEYGIMTTPVFSTFNAVTLSYQVHALKPARQVYDDVLRKLDVSAGDSIYIDDIEENVAAASVVGMHAFQFVDPDQLSDVLKRFGVL